LEKNKFKIILLIVFWLSSTSDQLFSQSQSIFEGIISDITLTDIDGGEHQLYEALNSGKHVIIDVFATWCGPCWEYHQSGELQEAYALYGPNGTNELMVYSIEGDNTTGVDELWGTGSSLGNYVVNTPYPIIESEEFSFLHSITNYPTILYICPDKEATQIGHLSSDQIKSKIDAACEPPSEDYDLDLLYFTSDMNPSCGSIQYLPQIKIQNGGLQTIDQVALKIDINGTTLYDSLGIDVFLPSLKTFDLPLIESSLEESTKFEISVLSVNNQNDSGPEYNLLSQEKLWNLTNSQSLTLELVTDFYGFETYWEILDESGAIVTSGGNDSVIPGAQQSTNVLISNPNAYEDQYSYSIPINLPSEGCYTFRIIDDFGDGICCNYGQGSFSIVDQNGTSIIEGGHFLDEHINEFGFKVIATSTESIFEKEPINIFPNPTSDILNIDFRNNQIQEVKIYDNSSKMVFQKDLHPLSIDNSFVVPVSKLQAGFYIIELITPDQSIIKSFVKHR